MFDRKSFISHHLTENNDKSGKNYSGFVLDYEGKQWGYIAEEGMYEAVNTGQKLNFAQFQNRQVDALTAEGGPAGAGAPTEHCFAASLSIIGGTGSAICAGLSAGDHFTLRSTQGTQRTYVVVTTGTDATSRVSGGYMGITNGQAIVAGTTLNAVPGAPGNGFCYPASAAELQFGAGSLTTNAVAVLVGTTAGTYHTFLNNLKLAIEGDAGHNGEIMVSAVTGSAARPESIVLTQTQGGGNGNLDVFRNNGLGFAGCQARIGILDGDANAAHTHKELDTVEITSTDGTFKKYVVIDDNATTVTTGTILAADTDIGSGTLASVTTGDVGATLAGGIAVAVNTTGTMSTQHAYLVQLKAAIEHANGHNGKILVGAIPAEANGPQGMTLQQATHGVGGQTVIKMVPSTATAARGFNLTMEGAGYLVGTSAECYTTAFRYFGAQSLDMGGTNLPGDIIIQKFEGGKGPRRNSQVIGSDIGATAAPQTGTLIGGVPGSHEGSLGAFRDTKIGISDVGR